MKNVIITGATRGLGLAVCRALLECGGYTVFAVARRTTEEFERLCGEYGGAVFFKSVDLSSPENARKAVFSDGFVSNKIPLYGLVNNAAQAYDDLLTNIAPDRLRAMFEVNVFAPVLLTKYAVRNMLLNDVRGSIVHVSSVCAHTGYTGLSAYAATKGALEAFSKNVAREWGRRGIRSNSVAAGFMETDMSASLDGDRREKIRGRTSLKRLPSPESVAKTVRFLLSDDSCSITGQDVSVDCGAL